MAVAKKAAAKKAAPAAEAPKLDAAAQALADAKAKYEAALEKLNLKKQAVTKAKRLIATGDKKLATLDKKIGEEVAKPEKAVEILLKKAADMEAKAEAMAAEQEEILSSAEEIEKQVEEKEAELETAKETAKAELEKLGVSTKSTRKVNTGTAAERRAKNNFQYRLKQKNWNIDYNLKNRIIGANGFGLTVEFEDKEFCVKKDDAEVLRHGYGSGSLIALANAVKEHGDEE
jgi:chromosome segregation ATPase